MVCLSRRYHFKFFKGCLPQISRGPFLNTLPHVIFNKFIQPISSKHFLLTLWTRHKTLVFCRFQGDQKGKLERNSLNSSLSFLTFLKGKIVLRRATSSCFSIYLKPMDSNWNQNKKKVHMEKYPLPVQFHQNI